MSLKKKKMKLKTANHEIIQDKFNYKEDRWNANLNTWENK